MNKEEKSKVFRSNTPPSSAPNQSDDKIRKTFNITKTEDGYVLAVYEVIPYEIAYFDPSPDDYPIYRPVVFLHIDNYAFGVVSQLADDLIRRITNEFDIEISADDICEKRNIIIIWHFLKMISMKEQIIEMFAALPKED